MTDFESFWASFPRRVGKLAAQKAYAKARRSASASDILAGVRRYVAHKPHYADFCHPTTWLNQGRWMDEYPAEQSVNPLAWMDECRTEHGGECGSHYRHDFRMKLDAMKREQRTA